MKRALGLSCPACGVTADRQPEFARGIRRFTFYICDTPTCPVSSFRVEWKQDLSIEQVADNTMIGAIATQSGLSRAAVRVMMTEGWRYIEELHNPPRWEKLREASRVHRRPDR